MSGGHWDYKQRELADVAEDMEGMAASGDYPKVIADKMRIGAEHMREAAIYMHRIDWLVSGDDGDDTFLSRLEQDLKEAGL